MTEHRKPKAGDIILAPIKRDNGKKKDSPKYRSWQEEKPFKVLARGVELWAVYDETISVGKRTGNYHAEFRVQ